MVTHLVENFREKLDKLAYMETFKVLVVKYEQMNAPIPDELSFTTVETEQTPNKAGPPILNGQRWQGLREVDPDEEAYFNGDDHDEEEEALSPVTSKTVSNGSSPIKPLVDYPDDDDDDDDDELSRPDDVVTNGAKAPSEESTAEPEASASTAADTASPPATVPPPPERIAEKRRRQDDDEDDELARIASQPPKRRLSGASTPSNSVVTGGHTLRRKKGMNAAEGKKKESKIAISLAVKAGEGQSGDS